MKFSLRYAVTLAVMAIATHASAQVTFYEHQNFEGRSFSTEKKVQNFDRFGFNDRSSSVIVLRERWEVCEDARFSGRCAVLRPGRYPSLAAMGLNDRVSSVRMLGKNVRVNDNQYAPPPIPVYDNQRRNGERLYEANVVSVRAVVGPPQQRCWVAREQIPQEPNRSNVQGALIGAVLGGILGHQVGNGRGNDLATVGGAIAGGAIGANVGRNNNDQAPRTQDVQRCTTVPNQSRPEFWDVTYNFRGQDHRIQMTTPPGPSVTVNRQGEPRSR